MRRLALVLLIVVVVVVAAWGTWRWWTAPPSASTTSMVAAATLAPDNADGLLVIADPARTARWLVRHPQALGLLPVAAPAAYGTIASLQPVLRALTDAAQGPLVIWWKGHEVGFGEATDTRAATGLHRVAELRGLAFDAGDTTVRIATDATLLDGGRCAAPTPPGVSHLAALARVRSGWWEGEASGATLAFRHGTPPDPPAPAPASRLEAADASALGAALTLPVEPFHGPACLAFAAGRGWALALPTASWPAPLRAALGGRWPQPAPGAVPGAERWSGLAGELFVLPRRGVIAASDAVMLAAVANCDGRRDEGSLAGADLAWAATSIASAGDRVAPLGPRLDRLRQAAPQLAKLAGVRWRLGADGGVVLLEW